MERKLHPRPQFVREEWETLDGVWKFSYDDENIGVQEKWYEGLPHSMDIKVPFTYETELSGINDQSHHTVVWYEKTVHLTNVNQILYFEGVDYIADVWINGHKLGRHKGAYERFSFELGEYAHKGENKIVVRVSDSLDTNQPRGKQRWLQDSFGCWYVQTTGIWKTVWIEEANPYHIEQIKLTPHVEKDQITCELMFSEAIQYSQDLELHLTIELTYDNKKVSNLTVRYSHEMLPIVLDTRLKGDSCWGTQIWWPEEPKLYDIKISLYDKEQNLLDEVLSYFGMRDVSIESGKILLNGMEIYQRLILDQGYWEESGITPPSVEALELDIQRIKELGYNGLRKHQKIEDERFLYLCDREGLLLWVEMPSTYTFTDKAIQNFTIEWMNIVQQHYNHPSVITWVPFNESWGIKNVYRDSQQQSFTESIYHLTKSIDSMRPVITNDGWEHTVSDILTLHDYEEYGEFLFNRYENKDNIVTNKEQFNKNRFAFAEGYEYKGQPIILSEFGGIAFSSEEGWGYGHQVKNQEEFLDRFDKIHQAIQDLPYISGFCYTQLTDVEQEVNGLLYPDRTPKLDANQLKNITQRS